MSQTSIILGSIVVAYVVFVTINNELPCYLEIIGVSTSGQCKGTCQQNGIGIQLTGYGSGVSFLPPTINAGNVSIQPPVIRL